MCICKNKKSVSFVITVFVLIFSLVFSGMVCVSASEVTWHTYNNGFCTTEGCGCYEPALQITQENFESYGLSREYCGYYAIYNAGQLYWFSEKVGSGETNINAVLLDDINVNTISFTEDKDVITEGKDYISWNPIGEAYSGCFDGNQHKISGLFYDDSTVDYVGFFDCTGDNVVIKNLTITDSFIRAAYYVGGIVGGFGKGEITNCSVLSSVIRGKYYIGGIVGRMNFGTISKCYNDSALSCWSNGGGIAAKNSEGTIENCGNTGSFLNSGPRIGGVVGELQSGYVRGCYNIGSVISNGAYAGGICGKSPAIASGWIKNCYYLTGCAIDGSGVVQNALGASSQNSSVADSSSVATGKSEESFKNGEVCFLLQYNQSGNKSIENIDIVWRQNIDNGKELHNSPRLEGDAVYCTKNENGDSVYSNILFEADSTEHNYENGFCKDSGCVAYEKPIMVTKENFAKLKLTKDYIGYFAVSNGGQLYSLADAINNRNAYLKVVLTADVKINDNVIINGAVSSKSNIFRTWIPMGWYTDDLSHAYFKGVFDGNGHTISGLYYKLNKSNSGLFACMEYAVVKDVGVIDSYFMGNGLCGGITGRANYSQISRSYFEGNIENIYGSSSNTGGIVGLCNGIHINNCYAKCKIVGGYGSSVGGIVGSASGNSTLVENCYSYGTISGGYYVGGICGNYPNGPVFSNCYYLKKSITDGKDYFQGGIGNATSGWSTADNGNATLYATAEDFENGKIAYLLQNANEEQTWGQADNTEGSTPLLTSDGFYEVWLTEDNEYLVNVKGDINGDGTVSADDYQAAVNIALDEEREYDETLYRADIYADKVVDVLDVALIERNAVE